MRIKKTKIYLAAGFSRKEEIKKYAAELTALGFEITSSWLYERISPSTELHQVTRRYLREHAQRDLTDIQKADALVLFTQSPTKPFVRGGRMHEAGYAMGLKKPLYLCGPRENIFHYLPGVYHCETWVVLKEKLL